MLVILHKYFTLTSIAIFQLTWMLCVFAGSPWFLIGVPLLALHFMLSPSQRADAISMTTLASMGILFDFSFHQLGFYAFSEGHFPIWLALLWLTFGASFYHCFGWLIKQPIVLQGLLGGIGGPLSYYTGMKVNAVSFPESLFLTLGCLSVFWALFFMIACGIKTSRYTYAKIINS